MINRKLDVAVKRYVNENGANIRAKAVTNVQIDDICDQIKHGMRLPCMSLNDFNNYATSMKELETCVGIASYFGITDVTQIDGINISLAKGYLEALIDCGGRISEAMALHIWACAEASNDEEKISEFKALSLKALQRSLYKMIRSNDRAMAEQCFHGAMLRMVEQYWAIFDPNLGSFYNFINIYLYKPRSAEFNKVVSKHFDEFSYDNTQNEELPNLLDGKAMQNYYHENEENKLYTRFEDAIKGKVVSDKKYDMYYLSHEYAGIGSEAKNDMDVGDYINRNMFDSEDEWLSTRTITSRCGHVREAINSSLISGDKKRKYSPEFAKLMDEVTQMYENHEAKVEAQKKATLAEILWNIEVSLKLYDLDGNEAIYQTKMLDCFQYLYTNGFADELINIYLTGKKDGKWINSANYKDWKDNEVRKLHGWIATEMLENHREELFSICDKKQSELFIFYASYLGENYRAGFKQAYNHLYFNDNRNWVRWVNNTMKTHFPDLLCKQKIKVTKYMKQNQMGHVKQVHKVDDWERG